MLKNGLKSVLVERLKEAVRNNVKLIEERPDDEVENIAGDGFNGNAYWKYIEQTGAEIDELVMEVEGINFRAPTTSEAEHNSDFHDRPKKGTMQRHLTVILLLQRVYSLRRISEDNLGRIGMAALFIRSSQLLRLFQTLNIYLQIILDWRVIQPIGSNCFFQENKIN